MKTYQLKFGNGETGVLRQLDDGSFACPICGTPWPYPPYTPNDGVLGPVHPVSAPAFGDVCEGCEVEFGVDEGIASYAPVGYQRKQWAWFRTKWLDRVGWSDDAMRQVRENLGISEDQARKDAEELRVERLFE
jgi:hypothetical protein